MTLYGLHLMRKADDPDNPDIHRRRNHLRQGIRTTEWRYGMNIEDFGPFTLSKSSHSGPQEGMCVMEMVSFLAGEEWSDNPPCSSPVVARFCQVINDRFGQDVRDKLQAYVPRLIGTASPNHDGERAEFLAWAAVRTFAPIALRKAGMLDEAKNLEAFNGTLNEARDICRTYAAAADAADAYAAAAAAAYAADAAADADAAAAAAAYAADAAVFKVLDGLLKIGPSGNEYLPEQIARVPKLKSAILEAS